MVRGRGQQPLTQASLEAHQKSEPSGDDEPKLAGGRITEELMAGVRERGWPHLWKALEELRTCTCSPLENILDTPEKDALVAAITLNGLHNMESPAGEGDLVSQPLLLALALGAVRTARLSVWPAVPIVSLCQEDVRGASAVTGDPVLRRARAWG